MNIVLFLLFLSGTVQYRFIGGQVSFALLEPIVLFVASLLLLRILFRNEGIQVPRDRILLLLSMLMLWVCIIRPWAEDWKGGLSDLRDWAIPAIGFLILLCLVRRGWRKWTGVFLVAVVIQAILGIYQHATDSSRPFIDIAMVSKMGYGQQEGDVLSPLVSFAVGLFAHPNGYAMYLLAGLMIAIGLVGSRKRRVLSTCVSVPVAIALYWSYGRSAVGIAVVAVFWFAWYQHSVTRRMTTVLLIGAVAGAFLFGWGNLVATISATLGNLYWRVGLWKTAVDVINSNPAILLLGNGMEEFGRQAYYGQPHNVYVYFLLQYGAVGLALLLGVVANLWRRGMRALKDGLARREPLLVGVWLALLGFFGVGLGESNLMGIENRQNLLMIVVLFIGLEREVREEGEREYSVGEVAARERIETVPVAI